jgi:Response regulator containing a CheY-like receiver domain and an HTH DNA-binding domain
MTSKPTVVIADDHPEMLEAVSHLLQKEFDIVSAVQDGVSALQVVTELKPAVVILDISMPKMDGIEVAQELKRLKSSSKIILISIQNDPGYIQVLTTMGASYVPKMRIQTDLIPAIRETLHGRVFVSPR